MPTDTFIVVFVIAYMFCALCIVVGGFVALFTKRSRFYIGNKVFDWTGTKAILGGIISIVVGSVLFFYAAYYWHVEEWFDWN